MEVHLQVKQFELMLQYSVVIRENQEKWHSCAFITKSKTNNIKTATR